MITLDFETRSAIDLIKLGATRYAMDPSTEVLCMSWAFDDEDEVALWHRRHPWIERSPRPDELLDRIASGEIVEAHNARFEYLIWNHVLMREFSDIDVPITLDQLRCSAAKASCVSLPRALGDAVAAVGLPHRKDPDGQRLINKLSKPMRRRRISASTSAGLACKTVMWLEIADHWNPGEIVTTQEAYQIARQVAAEHPSPVQDVDENMRDILHRKARQGYFDRPSDGVYVWTGKKPKQIAREDRPIDFIDDDFAEPAVVFCEEEIEHRRNWKYNQQDVRAERGLSKYCPEMTERELQFWFMDFRMNERGITLDKPAASAAVKLCEREVERLNAEMVEITNGQVQGGSKRIPFRKWANGQITNLTAAGFDVAPLPDTKADTLSFMLYGAPTKAGDEAKAAAKPRMDAMWESWGELGKPLHRAMEICLEVNRSSVAKYKQMMGSVCPDGRLHDIMLYNGADRTGRWSGKGVQPHNFVRGYMENMGVATLIDKKHPEFGESPSVWDDLLTCDLDHITLVLGEPLPALAKACRGALTATPGMELYAADFNAIEARKLAWMAGCASLLRLFQTGGDPYCDMASGIYSREITKADKTERQMGKKAVLGLGYAMGWEKFQITVWMEEGIWLDDEFCQNVVRIYRKEKYPEIPLLWRAIEKAAIAAVQEGGEHVAGGDELGNGAISYFVSPDEHFLHCRLPSGRLLAYLYPEVHTKVSYRYNALNERGKDCVIMFPAKVGVPMTRVHYHAEKMAEKQRKTLTGDPPESFLSPHLSFMGRDTYTKQWKRCGTHGGTLTENADQASSRDLLAESMFRVDETDAFDLLLSIHDEVIAEAPIGTATVKEFESLMAEVPAWAPGMPVAAEGWIGPRLRK